jgi:hypothetical protein
MHATSSIRQERRPAPSSHQTVYSYPSEWPPTCGFSIPRRVKSAFCPRGVRRGHYDIATDIPGHHRLRIAFDDASTISVIMP